MNTDYLRYFSTLAELQHYGNAAKALNISQPGLSHAIHSLEKDYGLPLFEKTGRNVRLSPYGLEIKKYIDVILNNLDELEQTISDFHREDKIIRIAISSGRSIISRHLISPRTVKRMLCNTH